MRDFILANKVFDHPLTSSLILPNKLFNHLLTSSLSGELK